VIIFDKIDEGWPARSDQNPTGFAALPPAVTAGLEDFPLFPLKPERLHFRTESFEISAQIYDGFSPFLTESALQLEFDLTHRKQTTEKFLTGARTHISDLAIWRILP
jgi:hypothetical protein